MGGGDDAKKKVYAIIQCSMHYLFIGFSPFATYAERGTGWELVIKRVLPCIILSVIVNVTKFMEIRHTIKAASPEGNSGFCIHFPP